jgi:hypothetical protein
VGKEEFRETTLTPGRETQTPQVQMQNKANRVPEYQLPSGKDEEINYTNTISDKVQRSTEPKWSIRDSIVI